MKAYEIATFKGQTLKFTNMREAWAFYLENKEAVSTFTDYTACEHFSSLEIGTVGHYENTKDCGYGCKVVKCQRCEAVMESHRKIYGCPQG